MKSEKFKIAAGFAAAGIALVGLIMFAVGMNGIEAIEMLLIVLTLVLVLGASYVVVARTKEFRKGLPTDDERSKMINWKAGAYSYFATIWIAVALLWYNTLGVDEAGLPELGTEGIVGVIVLLSGIIFIILNLVFNRRGNV